MTAYEQQRETLRQAELALMQQREAVAEARRNLPPGPIADNYTFGSESGDVTLADLTSDRPLVLYHFMFGDTMAQPCPMCAMWADGWNGVADHLDANVDFALVTNASVSENVALANERGWKNLRWLSAAGTSFKRDYGSSDADGNQSPMVTVFERAAGDGPDQARLSYSGAAHIADEHWRGVDLLSPVWHLLDLTRQGRGNFMPG